MTLANIDDNGLAQQSILDSFLAISRLYLQGAQRLSALNAAALRGMVADGATAMKALMGATSAAEGMEIQASMSNAMVGKVVAYTRGLHGLSAETQEEMSRQTLAPTSDASGIAEVPDSWQDAVAAICGIRPQYGGYEASDGKLANDRNPIISDVCFLHSPEC